MLTERVELASPLAPAEVLERLTTLGREGRAPEPGIGATAGRRRVRLTRDRERFRFHLDDGSVKQTLVCAGRVVAADDGGSRVAATIRLSRVTLVSLGAWLAWTLTLGVWGRTLALVLMGIGSAAVFVLLQWVFNARERAALVAVLRDAAAAA